MRSTLHSRVLSILVLFVFSIAFISCDSGGGSSGGNVSKDDAKKEISNADGDFSSTTSDLQTGEFGSTVTSLFGSGAFSLNSKTSHNPTLGEQLLDALSSEGIVQVTNGRLGYQTGEYSWNGSSWGAGSQSDNLVLNFPSSPNSSSNDLTFTLSAYSDTKVELESKNRYLPKTVNASLTKSGTEIFSVDLSKTNFYDATAGPSGAKSQVPQRFLLKALTAPQFHTFDYESTSKKDFSFDFSLRKNSENGNLALGILINATLTKNFDNISSDETGTVVDKLSGDLHLGPRLTLDYEFDVDELNDLGQEASIEDVNNNFAITVKVDGNKAGTIKVAEVEQNEQKFRLPVVQYNDGSKEPLNTALPNVYGTFSSAGGIATASKSALGTISNSIKSAFSAVF